MKQSVLIILLLFYSLTGFCQIKNLEIPHDNDGKISYWYTSHNNHIHDIKLLDLTKSKDSLHIRLVNGRQYIDIWTNDFIIFNGVLTNYTESSIPIIYDSEKSKNKNNKIQTHKTLYSKIKLDTLSASNIYKKFLELKVVSIQNQESMKNWCCVDDGTIYIIEYSNPTNYSFKSYDSPDLFKNDITEAKQIDSFFNYVETTLELNKKFWVFIKSLPLGKCYTTSSSTLYCTNKKKKK